MAYNLFISYDLCTPGQNYETVIERIKTLGAWAKVHYSLWYVRSNYTVGQARDHVWQVMDANDKLIVINANEAAWQNLDETVSQFIRNQWNQ